MTDLKSPNQLKRPSGLLGAEIQSPTEIGLGLVSHPTLYLWEEKQKLNPQCVSVSVTQSQFP